MVDHQSSANRRFNMLQFADRFLIVPNASGNLQHLEIGRYSSETQIRLSDAQIPTEGVQEMGQIGGIVGIVHLVSGPFLIVITGATNVGILNGAEIFRLTSTKFVAFHSDSHLNEQERRINQHLVEMLQSVLSTDAFYFSLQMDLSRTFQWVAERSAFPYQGPFSIEHSDWRFVWNSQMCEPFKNAQFSTFAIPLIHGFVGIRHCSLDGRPFKLALISRRSVLRAGVRFITRGIDQEGNCANFVESEQIVEFESGGLRHLSSFVQFRGSIPLLWSQKSNLKWQPDPAVQRPLDEQCTAYRKHFNYFLEFAHSRALPKRITIVNLINHYGREQTLGSHFRAVAEKVAMDHVKYVAFDFHRHCRSLNWDRLAMLKSELQSDIQQFGFFYTRLANQNGGKLTEIEDGTRKNQNGFFRINCMDCLDRTNVVQALLGLESLRAQFHELGVLSLTPANFDAWPDFVHVYKNLWADNGDDCSKQYSGTPALKSDYTRMGKRTFGGAMNDLQIALTRYFKQNFSDGYRQDALNLFLGNYTIDRANLPERVDHSMINFDMNGAAFSGVVFSVAMTILCVLVSENWTAAIFWLAILLAFSAFIWVNGDDFVDRPILLAPSPSSMTSPQQNNNKRQTNMNEATGMI